MCADRYPGWGHLWGQFPEASSACVRHVIPPSRTEPGLTALRRHPGTRATTSGHNPPWSSRQEWPAISCTAVIATPSIDGDRHGRVPAGMHPGVRDARRLEDVAPVLPVAARVDGSAVPLAEDEIVIRPLIRASIRCSNWALRCSRRTPHNSGGIGDGLALLLLDRLPQHQRAVQPDAAPGQLAPRAVPGVVRAIRPGTAAGTRGRAGSTSPGTPLSCGTSSRKRAGRRSRAPM